MRMDLVRQAINYIRAHWDQYPKFMRELREFMADTGLDLDQDDELSRQALALFSSVKDWSDRRLEQPQSTGPGDCSAIRLYTSEGGYQQIFRTINMAFRSDGLTSNAQALRCATFLVELLNIDLFNYREATASADNFEGVVYRGMCVSSEELAAFHRAAAGPVQERYLAVPLAMVSASADREVAIRFAATEAGRGPDRHLVLWEINVVGLDPELLRLYRARFPTTVVTSLCAVPIHLLSAYPGEQEVLLRGPFLHILRLREESDRAAGMPVHVIETLMLNSNRDHISTIASNEGADREAREMFATLVTMQRATICAQRADEHGQPADAASFRVVQAESRRRLESLLAAATGA